MAKYVNDTVAQKIANDIQKNRVNLGAFDTVDTSNANYNLISRNTWVVDLGTLNWQVNPSDGFITSEENFGYIGNVNEKSHVICALYETFSLYDLTYNQNVGISVLGGGNLWVKDSSISSVNELLSKLQGVILQYELPSSQQYTEKVIKGVPIHTLDQSGEEWLRSEWEKGLNLFDVSNYAYDGDSYRYFKVKISKLGTYYLSSTISPVRFELYQNGSKIFDFTESHSFALTSSNFDLTKTLDIYVSDNDGDYSVNANSVMLNEGDHPYPYQPYSGAIVREKDIENVAYKNVDNNFSTRQTFIDDDSDVPIVLKSHTTYSGYIQFINNQGNGIGYIGIDSLKPYFYTANSGVKPSGYLLTDNDIAELKALVYDNQYPAIESVDTTYSFNYTLPSSLNSNLTIFGAGMDISGVKGRSYVYNQLANVRSLSFTTSSTSAVAITMDINLISGHKYFVSLKQSATLTSAVRNLLLLDVSGLSSLENYGSMSGDISIVPSDNQNLTAGTKYGIYTCLTSVSGNLDYWCNNPSSDVDITDIIWTDLTQWFNGNIPSDLLSNPSLFLTKYYNGSLDHDTGTLIDSKLVSITSKGMNIWDEEWEENNLFSGVSGSKNFIEINSSNSYYFNVPSSYGLGNSQIFVYFYDKDKNSLGSVQLWSATLSSSSIISGSAYIKFGLVNTAYGTTYNHDICINISNSSVNGTYTPHIQDTVVPLANPIALKSAGSVQDTNSEKLVGSVDLGTLSWTYATLNGVPAFSATRALTDIKYHAQAICDKYGEQNGYQTTDKTFTLLRGDAGTIWVIDSSLSSSDHPTGTLYYELATPVAQQLILPQNINIQKGGSIEFNYDNGTPSDIELQFAVSKAGN